MFGQMCTNYYYTWNSTILISWDMHVQFLMNYDGMCALVFKGGLWSRGFLGGRLRGG